MYCRQHAPVSEHLHAFQVAGHSLTRLHPSVTDVALQAVVAALHAAASRRSAAFRARALAAMDKVLAASGLDLYSMVSELLLSGCLAAGKPKSQVGLGGSFGG